MRGRVHPFRLRQHRIMAHPVLFAALLAGIMSLLAARSAMAHVDVGVHIGTPVYAAPAPVYVAPPPPVVYAPRYHGWHGDRYWDGRRWYGRHEWRGRHHHYRHHHHRHHHYRHHGHGHRGHHGHHGHRGHGH
ncbi:conserved hypothetical protein; putative membrane protein [Cupriavidus taiwanensis]|nr:conserved hypothetical protein; putative membrane protein [Cupriavidus taiwanensis]SOY88692.1 conserved hypothetical protein; putative membrane protein [Cupriavidus taiwanensis]